MVYMPGNRFNAFSNHGVGIGLRIPHYQHIFEKKPVVDWFEIISENFMVDSGRPLEVLDQILEQYRVVQHGVAVYFGVSRRPGQNPPQKIITLGPVHEYTLVIRSPLLGKYRRALHA